MEGEKAGVTAALGGWESSLEVADAHRGTWHAIGAPTISVACSCLRRDRDEEVFRYSKPKLPHGFRWGEPKASIRDAEADAGETVMADILEPWSGLVGEQATAESNGGGSDVAGG